MLLAYHFFSVAFYSIRIMFTHPQLVEASSKNGGQPNYSVVPLYQYPALSVKALRVVRLVSTRLINQLIAS